MPPRKNECYGDFETRFLERWRRLQPQPTTFSEATGLFIREQRVSLVLLCRDLTRYRPKRILADLQEDLQIFRETLL